MSRFLAILFLSLTFFSVSVISHDKELPSAIVVGTVYCDTCFQQQFSKGSHFISGALVAVECKNEKSMQSFKKEVKTNDYGEFKVQLPFKVNKHAKRIKGCTFKLISSSEPHCAVTSISTSFSMILKARKQGEHTFSAGLFSFKPIVKPNFCNKNYDLPNSKPNDHVKNEIHPNLDKSQSDKNTYIFPPIPFLPPLPPLPFLPPLPPLPFLPPVFQPPFLPPTPFFPPVLPLPPQIPKPIASSKKTS